MPALAINPNRNLLLRAHVPWVQLLPITLSVQCNFSALLTFARQLWAGEPGSSQFLPTPPRSCYLVASVFVFREAQSSTTLGWRSGWFSSSLPGDCTTTSSCPEELRDISAQAQHDYKDAIISKHSVMSSLQYACFLLARGGIFRDTAQSFSWALPGIWGDAPSSLKTAWRGG